MDRASAVLLLREIMHDCESFVGAEAVGLSETKAGWILKAKWIRPQSERDCLNGIMVKYGAVVSELDGYTIIS